jgi:serine/threonine protein kinase
MNELHPGDVFAGRFEINRLAGSGGMGSVYLCRDRFSGGAAALKLLHKSGSDPHEAERFVREAQLLAELSHPGIVSYLGHGQTPHGQRFLAMEWLDGQDLGKRLARGPLALGEAIRLLRDIATALSAAHERGIVHRDIKPTNITPVGA